MRPAQAAAFSLPFISQAKASEGTVSVPDVLKDLPSMTLISSASSDTLDASGSGAIDVSILLDDTLTHISTDSAKNPSVLPISPALVKGISTYFTAYHPGIDIRADVGSPIMAIRDGVVVESTYQAGGYGNYVVVEHKMGDTSVRSLYAHMKSANVKVGDTVKSKDIVGFIGMTGHTTGPHLHLETRICNPDAQFYICPATDPIRLITKGLPGNFLATKAK